MSTIPTQLFAMKTATVTFTPLDGDGEGVDFSDHINELRLDPSRGSSQMAISGRKYSAPTSWTLSLGLFQDLDQTGLLRWLFDNEGEKFTMHATFLDGSDALEAVITASPAGIGGAASDQLATSTVSLDVDGKPSWISAD